MVLGIDGSVEFGEIDTGDNCCPPDLCNLTVCGLMCNFIQQLPTGPMWDAAKVLAFEKAQTCTDILDFTPFECVENETTCSHIVNHALYTARKTHMWLHEGLGPVFQESNPYTATQTLDDWLDRLGWQDCYDATCRSPFLGNLTPYEVLGECGPVFCPPETTLEFQKALKHAIVIALHRLSKGIIKNQASINFVLSSLGAEVVPSTLPFDIPESEKCCNLNLAVIPVSETISAAPFVGCAYGNTEPPQIQAWVTTEQCKPFYKPKVAGQPDRIYPGVLAAECIVRSLIRTKGCVTVDYYCE